MCFCLNAAVTGSNLFPAGAVQLPLTFLTREGAMAKSSLPPRFGFGVILIIIGFFLLLDNIGYYEFHELIGTWWPLILVYIGASRMITHPQGNQTGSAVVLGAGLFFLIFTTDINELDVVSVWWPVLLILLGGWVALNAFRPQKKSSSQPNPFDPEIQERTDDMLNHSTVFSGAKLRSASQNFTGGKITVAFGGTNIDLRETKLAPGAVLDVLVLFGGCELHVPENWELDVQAQAIFGGIDDKRFRTQGTDEVKPMLRVTGLVMFGGIEIK